MRRTLRKTNGITLLALVITIVVLLILASVTINMIVNGGIISKTKEATSKYKDSENAELNSFASIDYQMDKAVNGETINILPSILADDVKTTATTSNSKITLSDGNVAIPAGFKVIDGSTAKVSTGVIIEDLNGNQYVWIPVENSEDYKRTDFGKQYGLYSNYYEELSNNEKDSITRYKGYYISRYESGIDTARTSSSQEVVNSAMKIKNNKSTYCFVTRNQAAEISKAIEWKPDGKEYSTATTKLCSSYAWDTALKFIDKNVSNYSINNSLGNYSGTIANTGTTSSAIACNICDMGGNIWEWTSENTSSGGGTATPRGGAYDFSDIDNRCPGVRGSNDPNLSNGHVGFRVTLYM